MLWRYQRRAAKQQTVELPELHDHRVGDIESKLDFDRALAELSGVEQKVAILVLVLEYSPPELRSCSI
jgi:hypothetical protein